MSQSIEDIEAMDTFLKSKNLLTVPTVAIDGSPALNLPHYEAHFDCMKGGYVVKNDRGEFIPANEAQVKRQLKKLGYQSRPQGAELISQVEDKMCEIHESKDVRFAGAVAGHKVGLIENNNDGRILVTRGPTIIKPARGDWPAIKEFMTSLFGEVQVAYVYGWLKCSYKALASGEFTPGQALAIAGKAGNGKNFFQECIVTPLLGGREGLPFSYMSGNEFNADLIGAEHWMISDVQPSTDIRKRRAFGASIKDIVANGNQRLHGKGKDAVTVKPFIRLSITVNDETENLHVLPPIEDSLADKIMLLKSNRASNLPTQEEREDFRKKIEDEMPAFVHFLVNDYEIPQELVSTRYGITHYHNPEILERLQSLLPETKLDELVTEVIFKGQDKDYWEGTAIGLERVLRDSAFFSEVSKTLSWNQACGTYLGRLASGKETGKRYKKKRLRDGYQVWGIHRKEVVQQHTEKSGTVDQNHTPYWKTGA